MYKYVYCMYLLIIHVYLFIGMVYFIRHWHKMKSHGIKNPGKLEQHFTLNSHKAALSDYSNFVLHSKHIDNLLNKKHRENALNFSKQKECHKAVIRILFDVSRRIRS